MARASPLLLPGNWWSCSAGWPLGSPNSPAATSRGNKPWPNYPALVPAQRPPTAAWGGLEALLPWLGAQVGLAGKSWPPRARGPMMMLSGAVWCVSDPALAVPNWPLRPLRASCAGVWEYFSQVVFHVIKDVFYSLSADLWCSLGQYLFFSFNIFRSIKTLPVKYSPETQHWSGQEIF